jgi:methylmalonyl-CoA/ethylmalonyl-CoA epimerase
MILRIDHVSLAVKDYKKAIEFFTKILGAIPQTHGRDPKLQYYWEIFKLGDLSRLEIIRPTGKESFLKNFFKKKKAGIHHLTLQTPDIEKTKKFLEENNIPYFGYRNLFDSWKELFIHPKDAFGVLLQIAEFNPDDWLASSAKMTEGKRWSVQKINKKYALTFAHPGGGKTELNFNKEEIKNLISDLKILIE